MEKRLGLYSVDEINSKIVPYLDGWQFDVQTYIENSVMRFSHVTGAEFILMGVNHPRFNTYYPYPNLRNYEISKGVRLPEDAGVSFENLVRVDINLSDDTNEEIVGKIKEFSDSYLPLWEKIISAVKVMDEVRKSREEKLSGMASCIHGVTHWSGVPDGFMFRSGSIRGSVAVTGSLVEIKARHLPYELAEKILSMITDYQTDKSLS